MFFRCIFLPTGYKLPKSYSIQFMCLIRRYTSNSLGTRIHPYMEKCHMASKIQKKSLQARRRIDHLLRRMGLRRKPEKENWERAPRLENLDTSWTQRK